jgi:hypothetical protein
MRSQRAAVVLLVVAAAAWIGVGLVDDPSPDGAAVIEEDQIRPVENGSALWPYTSRSRSVAGRTLAITVVVTGDGDAVRHRLSERTTRDWEPTQDDARAAIEDAGFDWRPARGAARYTYISPPDADGEWITADYQLASGSYLGTRLHIRAFSPPNGEWTALQAHQEYWDWFRLRHTVTGVSTAGDSVIGELDEGATMVDIRRLHHDQRGGGGDGSLWLVELALVTLLSGSVFGDIGLSERRLGPALRRAARGLPVVAGLVVLYLGVRVTGIGLELALPSVDPRLFVVALYPVLAAGIPVLVWRLAPRHRPTVAFGLASLGLGIGIGLDLWSLGVAVIPTRLLLHRVVLVAAIGVLAAGFAQRGRTGRRIRWLGAAAWVGALLLPLADLV